MFGHQILSSLSFPKLISSLFLTSHPIIPPLHMELIWSWCVHFLGCIFCEMNQSNTSFSLCTQNWFFSLSHISSYHPIIINLHMGLLWIWHVRFLYWTYCPISTTGAFGWPFTSHFSFKCVIWGVIQPPPPPPTDLSTVEEGVMVWDGWHSTVPSTLKGSMLTTARLWCR